MKAIVLAGGFGSRLAHITQHTPKPMAKIGGRPFLEYLLDNIINQGVDHIILSVGYKWKMIESHFSDCYKGVPVSYVVESVPLGTGGATQKAFRQIDVEDALVLNGDTFCQVDLRKLTHFHQSNNSCFTMTIKSIEDVSRFGRVQVTESGVIQAFLEKGYDGHGLINTGVYVIKKSLFQQYSCPESFSLEMDLIEKHLLTINPLGFLTDRYFIDIGIPEDYERANCEMINEL